MSEAEAGFSGALDALLERTSATLEEIRAGINVQSAAVSALVEQASAGIGKAGVEAAESLAANVDHANSALDGLSHRVAEQDRASQRMIAEIDRGLALIDERFTQLAAHGDERANRFLESLSRARDRARQLGRAGKLAGPGDRRGRRADRSAARKHRQADGRNPRQPRHGHRRGARRRRPARRSGDRPSTGNRLDSRRGGRSGRAACATGEADRRAAGPPHRPARERRRGRRRSPVEAGELASKLAQVEQEAAASARKRRRRSSMRWSR